MRSSRFPMGVVRRHARSSADRRQTLAPQTRFIAGRALLQLPESRQRLHLAPCASECGLRCATESSRPSAPPCNRCVSGTNHAILFRKQKPRWFRFPGRRREPSPECISPRSAAARLPESWSGPAKPCEPLRGETLFGHPDQPMHIRLEMRSLRVRRRAIKHICNRLTLSGRQRRYVHERLYPIIVRPQRSQRPHTHVPPEYRPTWFSRSRVEERLCHP